MPNPLKARPLDGAVAELMKLGLSPATVRLFQDTFTRIDLALTNLGQVQATAPVTGRDEGLGVTVQKLTTVGELDSTDSIAADGTGSPLTGGRRGFNALDANNRLASSQNLNPVDAASLPTSSTALSNTGAATLVTVAAQGIKFSFGTVNYGAGLFDPLAYGTWYAYVNDPTFAGGTLPIQFTADGGTAKAGDKGNVYLGAIKSTAGTPQTGGGDTGGTTSGGSGGSRQPNQP